MTLVDTSAWIHSLRADGDRTVSARVRALLEAGEAAWCALVQLELWNGARGERERRVMADLAASLPSFSIDDAVWLTAVRASSHGPGPRAHHSGHGAGHCCLCPPSRCWARTP